jgi:hypothetical protein
MYQGRTVFSQLVEFLPRRAFENAVERYGGASRVRRLSCMDQLLAMIFAQVTGRSSLRDTVLCLRALGRRRYHCGFRGGIARSTLAEANEKRDWRIFQDTAVALILSVREELPIDPDLQHFEGEVYALDSTTVDLCLSLFPWAKFRRRKAAVKAHTLMDLRRGIPAFVCVSHGKKHDVWMLDQIIPEAGAFYVFDKAYVDFARLYHLNLAGAFFVTRMKRNADYRAIQGSGPAGEGIVSDVRIRMRGPKTRTLYPDVLRKIRYVDPEDGKRLTFLTNAHLLPASVVALLYKKRWKIELLFKWIKQHLRIKSFYGVTPNAVQIQIWVAVMVFVLVIRLRHRYRLSQEPGEIAQVLSVACLEKTPVDQLFSDLRTDSPQGENHNQLTLFDL